MAIDPLEGDIHIQLYSARVLSEGKEGLWDFSTRSKVCPLKAVNCVTKLHQHALHHNFIEWTKIKTLKKENKKNEHV